MVIELKRGAQPRKVLNQLLKYTPLQTTFGVNNLALVHGEPRLISLRRALRIYIEHRQDVITRRSQFELDKAKRRAHILEGLLIALSRLDEVIATIRQSPDADVAQQRLMERFGLTEVQAQAILDMQLRRLAALEREKVEQEYAKVMENIAYLEDLLAHPEKILGLIKEDVLYLKGKYSDPRRTTIASAVAEDFTHEDLIPDEDVLISITQRGYIKRVRTRTYRSQGRGGQGVIGMMTREEDAIRYIMAARTLNDILFFTDRGRVFRQRVHQLPDADRQAKGVPLVNVLPLNAGERVTASVAIPTYEKAFLAMVTARGKIKRVHLAEFASVRPSGLIAMSLEEGDYLGWVKLTQGDDDLIIVTERGQALRFGEGEVRPSGRAAAGVRAIRLAQGDRVSSMDVVVPNGELLVITATGFGKRAPLGDYPVKHRGGGGVATISRSQKASTTVAAARVVRVGDEILIISSEGMVIRTDIAKLQAAGRAARGSRIMALKGGDRVASMAWVAVDKTLSENQPEPPAGNQSASPEDGHGPGK